MLLKLLTPVLSTIVIRRLRVGPEEAVAALAEAEAIFGEVDTLLADGRSFLLATEQPSYIGNRLVMCSCLQFLKIKCHAVYFSMLNKTVQES